MSIIDHLTLMAPHKLPQTTIFLPNPMLSDELKSTNQVDVKQFMTGGLGTYVKRNDRRIFTFNFELTAEKDEELRRFVEAYVAETWRMYHWDETVWAVNLVNPEYFSTSVAVYDYKECSLELEGYKL